MLQLCVAPSLTLRIRIDKPKYPQYVKYTERRKSFDTWPDFVDAGLVYTGIGDSVRCYFCGGGLRDWDRDGDLVEKHAKWYPACSNILSAYGQAYVETLLKSWNPKIGGSSLHAEADTGTRHIESVAAQSCLEMDFPKEKVEKAIRIFIKRYGSSNFKGEDLCEILFEIEENEGNVITDEIHDATDDPQRTASPEDILTAELYESLQHENQTLKQDQICNKCMADLDHLSLIAYHHLVSCHKCYPLLCGFYQNTEY